LLKRIRLHGIIRRAEIDCLGDDLLLAATRADGLVVHAIASVLLVLGSPFGIDRIREGCAGAGDVGGMGRNGDRAQGETDGDLQKYAVKHVRNPLELRLVKAGRPALLVIVKIEYDMFVTAPQKVTTPVAASGADGG